MNRLVVLAVLALTSIDSPATVTTFAPVSGLEITVSATIGTKITGGPDWVKVEWQAEPTVPEKPVKPDPPPPPGPTTPSVDVPTLTGPVWIAAVYDRSTADTLPPSQQALLLSKTLFDQLKTLQITWSSWDKSDPGLKDWMADAGSTYPTLLVIWAGGHKSKTFPLPTDDVAMLSFAKKLRGQP